MNIFAKAAETLMRDGHCKGKLFDNDGRRCALGALGVSGHDMVGAAQVAADKLRMNGITIPPLPENCHPLARWNDDPATSAEDVILLFKELAHEAE